MTTNSVPLMNAVLHDVHLKNGKLRLKTLQEVNQVILPFLGIILYFYVSIWDIKLHEGATV